MTEFVFGAKISDLEDGQVILCNLEGQAIALAAAGGSFYAFDDTCTHAQCSLSEGELDGTTIICPCHDGEFDITTGEVLDGPPDEPIVVYPVSIEGDEVRIEV